jgi:dienelactone hydrolase
MEFREQIITGVIYFVFAYLVALGFWQLIAAWQRLKALSWLRSIVRARWGYSLGSALMVLACLWFFGTRTEEIFSPGPASSEFLFFLAAGLLSALATTILISLLVDKIWGLAGRRDERVHHHTETVSFKGGRAALHLPSSQDGPCPVVCMVPPPGEGMETLKTMAARLVKGGFASLVLDVRSGDSWQYPDLLALLPRAIAYLEDRSETDARRLGALGVGLGGDLVVRAAASDKQIRAVVALSPLLVQSSVEPGLDLLREMSYPEAIRWTHLRGAGELVTSLRAGEHIPELDPRPLLVVYGKEDRVACPADLLPLLGGPKVKLIPERGHRDLVCDARVLSSTVGWFRSHL